jgi:hypothetical protein
MRTAANYQATGVQGDTSTLRLFTASGMSPDTRLGAQRLVIEMTPVLGGPITDRGVVREGPVGFRLLGRSPLFRYEVRRWRDGTIPDLAEAVAGPHVVSADATRAREVLRLAPLVPALVWGRDESRTGEMWNSNSLTAWLLAGSGHRMAATGPPTGGRAPGWQAGLTVAARSTGCELRA